MGAGASIQGKPRHFTGTATTTPALVLITNDKGINKFSRYTEIGNLDTTNTLQFSFDNGTTWTSIKPSTATREIPGTILSFMVKTVAGTAAWEAICTIAE